MMSTDSSSEFNTGVAYIPTPVELHAELEPVLQKWSLTLGPKALADALINTFISIIGNRGNTALPAATLRGLALKESMKLEEGGHVSADEARRFLNNVSKTTILAKYRAGKLLAWKEGRAFRFPVWQFSPEGGLIEGMEKVLHILHKSPVMDDWGKVLFFLNPRSSLKGKRPLDSLRAGDTTAVLRLAEGELE